MFFTTQKHKRRNPYLTITVVGLAMVGAVSTVNSAKRFVMNKMNCIKGFFTGAGKCECADNQKCDSQKSE